jgi:hypothetical protein
MQSHHFLPGQGFITQGKVNLMLHGETILSGAPSKHRDEDMHPNNVEVSVDWGVFESGGGFYIGTWCNYCGPNSRESTYFPTRQAAQECFDKYWKQHLDEEGNWTFPDIPEMLPGERY